jgi:predicted dehydrogenase
MNIGLIGCGRIATDHLMIYRQIKDARVVAVSDIDLQRARFLADKNGIDKIYKDYTDLFEIKDLDFVDVCTPPSTHASIVGDATEFGHNVLLEKPMALSTDECERMIHKVEKQGTSLCICHNQLFFPAIRKAKQLVDSGNFDIVSFRTSVKENPDLYGVPAWNTSLKEKGLIWEVGCHPAYLQLHFLKNVTDVYAVGSKVRNPVFDDFSVILRTSSQTYGIMEVSWLAKETEKIYEINSADGKRAFMISPPPIANRGYEILQERSGIVESGLRSELRKVLLHFVKKETALGYFIGHFLLINSYIKSLRRGSSPPVPPEEGKRAVRLLECIEQSLNTNEIVSMQ